MGSTQPGRIGLKNEIGLYTLSTYNSLEFENVISIEIEININANWEIL